jgi:glycosyltransferase involved in cell wall biosynthesis
MGGPAQQASLLSGRRLDPERFETLLVHGSLAPGEESMEEMAHREGAHIESIPSLVQPVSPRRDVAALRRLTAVARGFRPDIVHTHTAKAGFLGRTAALSLRPRPAIVHTFHGHVLEGYFGRLKGGVYRTLEKRLGRSSDCLIGVSEATVDDLVRLGVAPRERFRVIRLGLDLDPFLRLRGDEGDSLRRELGVGDGEVLLTYVGRVVPIKRLDVLLRGVAEARDRGAPVRLAIVGDGEIRPDLEQLTRELGLGDVVSFLGYRSDLAPIAAAGNVAVLSSDNEGTPVSLIEAAAAGRPAVASDVGGVGEVIVPETGILFPANDHVALARGIAVLAGDPARRAAMGERARERASRRYSVERLLTDISELYEELSAPLGEGS